MEQYLSNADLVIEGIVLDEAYAIRNTESGSIETVHTIRIDKVLKGAITTNSIEVHTPGGRLDDVIESVSHGSTLGGGQKGIFLLSSNTSGASLGNGTGGYHLHGGNAGKITRLKYDDDYEAIHWGELDKYASWRQLREQVGASLGVDLTIHALTASELQAMGNNKEFCVKLDNPVPNVEDMTLEFDVMAKSSVPGLKFARAEVIIDYPTGNLGDFIVDQEKIEAGKGDITDGPAYTVAVEDKSEDQIELSIESPCDNNEPHYVLDTVYEKLATLTIEVNEWGDFGTMNVNDFSVAGTAEFVNPANFQGTPGCTEFDDLCGEGEFVVMTCTIDGILLLQDGAAGARNTVVFSGSDFGDGTDGRLLIPNADEAIIRANHDFFNVASEVKAETILEWEDTFVEVKISSNPSKLDISSAGDDMPFGSGKWRIRPNGGLLGCNADIDVPYAYNNYWYEFVEDQKAINYSPKKDSEGNAQSLKVFINENLRTQIGANALYTSAQFESLIRKYVCYWATALNIDIEVSTGSPNIPPHGYIVLRGSFVLDALTHGNTTFGLRVNGNCNSDLIGIENTTSDIQFNLDDSWYVSEDNNISNVQYDFLSILMHELGHALGFDHAMDGSDNGTADSKLMFHRLNAGDIKRIIDNHTVDGAVKFSDLMRSSNTGCFSSKDVALKPNTCIVSSVLEPKYVNGINQGQTAYITFTDAKTNINNSGKTISEIYNVSGGKLSSIDVLNESFPAGIYFIHCSDGEVVYVVKTALKW